MASADSRSARSTAAMRRSISFCLRMMSATVAYGVGVLVSISVHLLLLRRTFIRGCCLVLTGEHGLRCCTQLPPLLLKFSPPHFHHVNLIESTLDNLVAPAMDLGVVVHVA